MNSLGVLALIASVALALVLLRVLIALVTRVRVIVRKAREPQHLDHGNYGLSQGHEVRSENE